MKTIAITIDEKTLATLDRLSRGAPSSKGRKAQRGNRSAVVRLALQEFLATRERSVREAAEWGIWSKNIDRLNRDAAALVEEQAEP
jgi:metal-responsive CopG/Arc/MetJ family transcriptional regulator